MTSASIPHTISECPGWRGFLLKGAVFFQMALLAVSFCAGCAGGPQPLVSTRPAAVLFVSQPAGHAVQLGAFSQLRNAARFTESLRRQGLDVYYFRHTSGLFKVRMGDYPTRRAAEKTANRLVAEGLVSTFYIILPQESAYARSRQAGPSHLRDEIVNTAESYIGLPYQWGGTSPATGFDCSGLTMTVYRHNGLSLPRSSGNQFRKGRAVSLQALDRGDLVFFNISNGRKVSHVGIYRGNGTFIHAPGAGKRIRIDALTNGWYRSRFAGGRAYF